MSIFNSSSNYFEGLETDQLTISSDTNQILFGDDNAQTTMDVVTDINRVLTVPATTGDASFVLNDGNPIDITAQRSDKIKVLSAVSPNNYRISMFPENADPSGYENAYSTDTFYYNKLYNAIVTDYIQATIGIVLGDTSTIGTVLTQNATETRSAILDTTDAPSGDILIVYSSVSKIINPAFKATYSINTEQAYLNSTDPISYRLVLSPEVSSQNTTLHNNSLLRYDVNTNILYTPTINATTYQNIPVTTLQQAYNNSTNPQTINGTNFLQINNTLNLKDLNGIPVNGTKKMLTFFAQSNFYIGTYLSGSSQRFTMVSESNQARAFSFHNSGGVGPNNPSLLIWCAPDNLASSKLVESVTHSPMAGGSYDLGKSSAYWGNLYVVTINSTTVNATTFNGALNGNANTATKLYIAPTTNTTYRVPLCEAIDTAYIDLYNTSDMTYDHLTKTLTVLKLEGTSTNSNNLLNTTTNTGTYNILFSEASANPTDYKAVKVDTPFTYDTVNNTLSCVVTKAQQVYIDTIASGVYKVLFSVPSTTYFDMKSIVCNNNVSYDATNYTLIAINFQGNFLGNATTATTVTTVPALTGHVTTSGLNNVTSIASSVVTNTMLAGSIADSKLLTISTAGKVSNSATTATSTNTASTIVLRDASGNFSAGTMTGLATGVTALAITNAMLAGSISDTKLLTISTSGKVSNSATSAVSTNTPSTIVLRDASGNFSAGTITGTTIDTDYLQGPGTLAIYSALSVYQSTIANFINLQVMQTFNANQTWRYTSRTEGLTLSTGTDNTSFRLGNTGDLTTSIENYTLNVVSRNLANKINKGVIIKGYTDVYRETTTPGGYIFRAYSDIGATKNIMFDISTEGYLGVYNSLYINGNIVPNILGYLCGTFAQPFFQMYSTAYVVVSQREKKTDIRPCLLGKNFLLKLNPSKYKFKDVSRTDNRYEYGLIYDEVERATKEEDCDCFGALHEEIKDGVTHQALNYNAFIPVLIKGFQEQQQEISTLQNTIKAQQEQIERLSSMMLELITIPIIKNFLS